MRNRTKVRVLALLLFLTMVISFTFVGLLWTRLNKMEKSIAAISHGQFAMVNLSSPSDVVGVLNETHGGTGETNYSSGELLIGNDDGGLTVNTLTGGTNINITNGDGTITINLDGTVDTENGGTGQSSYTDGEILIGTSVGNTLVKNTITAGVGIVVTNGPGEITIGATGINTTIEGGTNIDIVTTNESITIGLTGTIATANGGTGQTTYTNGQLLIGNAGGSLSKNTLTAGTNIGITNGNGAVTVGLTGTVATANGGTGQTTYTNGQLLIGNAGTLSKSTLTAGSGISITNGAGTITVAATGVQAGIKMWAFNEQLAEGTNAGPCVSGFQTRRLNTVQFDGGSDVTLNTTNYRITFAPGTYYMEIYAPAVHNRHQLHLVQWGGGGVFMYGTSEDTSMVATNTYIPTRSICSGFLTFGVTETIVLLHYTADAIASDYALGLSAGFGPEIYSKAIIMKLA